MEFYYNLAVSVMLQLIKDEKLSPKFRRAILKVFKAIVVQYGSDPEFAEVIKGNERQAS